MVNFIHVTIVTVITVIIFVRPEENAITVDEDATLGVGEQVGHLLV